jgi:hypothetical protein
MVPPHVWRLVAPYGLAPTADELPPADARPPRHPLPPEPPRR